MSRNPNDDTQARMLRLVEKSLPNPNRKRAREDIEARLAASEHKTRMMRATNDWITEQLEILADKIESGDLVINTNGVVNGENHADSDPNDDKK